MTRLELTLPNCFGVKLRSESEFSQRAAVMPLLAKSSKAPKSSSKKKTHAKATPRRQAAPPTRAKKTPARAAAKSAATRKIPTVEAVARKIVRVTSSPASFKLADLYAETCTSIEPGAAEPGGGRAAGALRGSLRAG